MLARMPGIGRGLGSKPVCGKDAASPLLHVPLAAFLQTISWTAVCDHSLGVPLMKQPVIRKQVCVFLPLSDWRLLRDEAIRRRIAMTELCRRWVEPQLRRLRRPSERDVPV